MQKLGKLIKQIGQHFLELRRPFKIALAILFLVVLSLLVYPFQTVVVPAWTLQVVDDAGQPVEGMKVTEHWRHYLLEDEGHEELQLSSGAGRVSFLPQTIRASVLRKVLATVGKLGSSGSAARRDRYAAVVVWGSQEYSVATSPYVPEQGPPETIIVRRLR